jgi:NAD+ diphosphatase
MNAAPRRILFSGNRLWVRGMATPVSCLFPSDAATDVPARWVERFVGPDETPIDAVEASGDGPPAGVGSLDLRSFHDVAAPGEYVLASRAFEFLHWRRSHRFCGHCGRPLKRHATERAMVCETCRDLVYPRTNPVVITRITRGREILLARRAVGPTHFHSVVAGFAEAAETLEQAAVREIAEEVGIRVRNLRYFSSQPWPFPNNLMVAFTAEYDGGEIRVDGREIAEAAWYDAARLPPLPPPISIARRLIDDWLARGS